MSQPPQPLRPQAEALAAPLPALLAKAQQLAANVHMGAHGRRRAGFGDTFWQYRPAQNHDEMRAIDWRRSGRSDTQFVREKEHQIAQCVQLWIDRSDAMNFASQPGRPMKLHRAQLIGLAAAILLSRAGERVGLLGAAISPRQGQAQIERIAQSLTEDVAANETESNERVDFGAPNLNGLIAKSRLLLISDFLGDLPSIETAVNGATGMGGSGVLLQVLDPAEEVFPYHGRTIFESMAGKLKFETLRAQSLRDLYLERLADRKDRLNTLARKAGWHFHVHHTDQDPSAALLWLLNIFEQTA